ncbi:TetR/AcrR family transcriptional regulator C-terminal domain-containing protein [Bacillus pumilus]|uniref:TetR/AcrR family transcriptional regulator C-terminal domain-containing protein n=1 Tax=Bacillus pumilus TaxID=1408 RepID=UPI0039ECC89C
MPQGTNFLQLTEHLLAALHEGGIKSTSAAWGVDLLLLYVSSVAYEKVSWKKHDSSQVSDTKKAFHDADKTRFPFIHRVKKKCLQVIPFQWNDSDGELTSFCMESSKKTIRKEHK